jgi:hypothetical protein
MRDAIITFGLCLVLFAGLAFVAMAPRIPLYKGEVEAFCSQAGVEYLIVKSSGAIILNLDRDKNPVACNFWRADQ